MQDNKQVPAQAPTTVEDVIHSALTYQQQAHDTGLPDAVRKDSYDQMLKHRVRLTDLLGDADPRMYGAADAGLNALDYGESTLQYLDRRRTMKPEEVDEYEKVNFPRAWTRDQLAKRIVDMPQGQMEEIGAIGQAQRLAEPSRAELEEMMAMGSPEVESLVGIPRLYDDSGKLRGTTVHSSAWRSVKERFGVADPAVVLDDEVAGLTTDFDNPVLQRERQRRATILYGQEHTREDGSRYVSAGEFNADGSDPDFDIPNLSDRHRMDVTMPNGVQQSIQVDDDLIRDVVQAREGGFLNDRILEFAQRRFQGEVDSAYPGKKLLLPKISGNAAVDRELAQDPKWQRAIRDVPRPSMRLWDGFRTAYFMAEFGGSMLATRGIVGGASKLAAPLVSGAGAALSEVRGAAFVGRGLEKIGAATMAGARGTQTATRVVYMDPRLFAQTIGYRAIAGAANGEFAPGKWTQEGWHDGVSMYLLGMAGRLTRAIGMGALSKVMPKEGRYAQWRASLKVDDDTVIRGAFEKALGKRDVAVQKNFAEFLRKGLVDARTPHVQADFAGALFDSAVIGLGTGAYTAASQEAVEDGRVDDYGRPQVGVGDFMRNIFSGEAGAQALGMAFGHALTTVPMALHGRSNPDRVSIWGGALGVKLGKDQFQSLNETVQFNTLLAKDYLASPDTAALVHSLIANSVSTPGSTWEALRKRMDHAIPESAMPPVAGGQTRDQLMAWLRADPRTLKEALEFASEEELMLFDSTVTNWDWGGRGKPNADALETHAKLRELVGNELTRRDEGGKYSSDLTGQLPSERVRQAQQNLRDAQIRERQQRSIMRQWSDVRGRMKEALRARVKSKDTEVRFARYFERMDAAFREEVERLDDPSVKPEHTDGLDLHIFSKKFDREAAVRAEQQAPPKGSAQESELFRGRAEKVGAQWQAALEQFHSNRAKVETARGLMVDYQELETQRRASEYSAEQDRIDQNAMARAAELEQRKAAADAQAAANASRIKAIKDRTARKAELKAEAVRIGKEQIAQARAQREAQELERQERIAAKRRAAAPAAAPTDPPSGEQLGEALGRIASATEVTPGSTHLMGDAAASVDRAMDGRDAADPRSVIDAVRETEAAAQASKSTRPPSRLRKKADAAAPPPPDDPAQAEVYWADRRRSGAFVAGANALSPGQEGGAVQALYGALQRGLEATMVLRHGAGQAAQAQAREVLESLAAGVLYQAGLNEKADGLAIALSGLTAAEVKGIRERLLRGNFSSLDPQIDLALEEVARELTGRPVLNEKQLSGAGVRSDRGAMSTRQLLRLLAMQPEFQARESESGLFQQNRAELITALKQSVAVNAEGAVNNLALRTVPGGASAEFMGEAARRLAVLEDVISGYKRTGLRVESPVVLLRKKIAQALTGDQMASPGDPIAPDSGVTVGLVVRAVVDKLVGGETVRGEGRARRTVTTTGQEGEARKGLLEKGASSSEQSRTGQDADPVGSVNRLTGSVAHAERARRRLKALDLMVGPELFLIDENAAPEEVARTEHDLIRGVLDGKETTLALLAANGRTPAEIDAIRADALESMAQGQELMLAHVHGYGMPSGAKGTRAIQELEFLFQAIAQTGRGKRTEGKAAQVLEAAGWLTKDGYVRADAHRDLLAMVFESATESVRRLDAMYRENLNVEGRDSLNEHALALGKVRRETQILFAGGTTPQQLRTWMLNTLDSVTGYYDRWFDSPYRAEYESISARGQLSMNRVLNDMLRGRSGPTLPLDPYVGGEAGYQLAEATMRSLHDGVLAPFAQRLLRVWQATGAGKSRGLGDARTLHVNKLAGRADASGLATMHRVIRLGHILVQKFVSERIGLEDRLLLTKVLDSGFKRDMARAAARAEITEQEVWTRMFGPERTHLYDRFVELNEFWSQIGEMAVHEGLISPEQRATLFDRYVPIKTMRLVFDMAGRVSGIAKEGTGKESDGQAGFEKSREGEITLDDVRRRWDPLYLVPKYSVEASQRLRVFHVANQYIQQGLVLSLEDYIKQGSWLRSQWDRLGSKGYDQFEFDGKTPAVGMSMQERKEFDTRDPGVTAEEFASRRKVDIYSAMIYEWIQRERLSHDGIGQPAMTEKMRKTLDLMENGYVPMNVKREFALMLDQADLSKGSPLERSAAWEVIDQTSQLWRQMRTVYNPRHWALQLMSNWITNASAGKVPLHDILDPNGSMRGGMDALAKWSEVMERGEDPAASKDRDVQHVHRMIERSGGNTLSALIAPPIGAGLLEGFTGSIEMPQGVVGRNASDSLTGEFAQRALAGGGFMSKMQEVVHRLSNDTAPESRAEAQRALHGMYAFVDLAFKYAAQREGEKLGMSEDDAWHWGTEGTGDFSDVNPTVRMFSSQSRMGGELYRKGRERLSAADRKWLTVQRLTMQGIGGPFWMYWASMTPTLNRAAINHPVKTIMAAGVATYMIRLVSQLMGGDDTEQRASQDGRGTFANSDVSAMEALAHRYPNLKVKAGPFELAFRDWLRYSKAFLANTAHVASFGAIGHEDPEAGMLFRAQGPTSGGRSTELNFGTFLPQLQTFQGIADFVHTGGDPKAFENNGGRAQELGLAFYPTLVASLMATGSELSNGVHGVSFGRVWAEQAADWARTWSTPWAGLPWIFSREGQAAVGTLVWDGRSLGEAYEHLPPSTIRDSRGKSFGLLLAGAVLPVRGMSRTSVEEMDTDRPLFGRRARRSEVGDEGEEAVAKMQANVRNAIQNALSQSYKKSLSYGGPPNLWMDQALNLSRDLVAVEPSYEAGAQEYDVVSSPQTTLGRFIRSATLDDGEPDVHELLHGSTPEPARALERRLLVQEVINQLNQYQEGLVSLADSPDSMVHRRVLSPELFDRFVRAKMRGPVDMLELVHRQVCDPKMLKAGSGKYMSEWDRVWNQEGLAAQTAEIHDTATQKRRREVIRALGKYEHLDGPEYPDSREAHRRDTLRALGPPAIDLLPDIANKPSAWTGEAPSDSGSLLLRSPPVINR